MSESSRHANPTRRDFVLAVGAAGLSAAAGVGPRPADPAETPVARLFKALSTEQREAICFPSGHPLRSRSQNNWAIVGPTIGAMTAEQQGLCREILRGITSEDGFGRFIRQMDEDAGGFGSYHVALFGEPGAVEPFEWVLTGRHVTLRADGNAAEGGALGGPIFYGHGSKPFSKGARHDGNVWWDQAEQAIALFEAMDGDQQARALDVGNRDADASRPEATEGGRGPGTGILVAELDGQQRRMVRSLIGTMLSTFREADARGVMALLEATGGVESLRLTYSTGEGRVRDVWKVEGPAFSWHFHGEPHVHSWLDLDRRAASG